MTICALLLILSSLVTTSVSAQSSEEAQITVSNNLFPASRTCRLPTFNAADCNESKYTTFVLTITLADLEVYSRGAFRISFGYKYNDTYRLESAYTRYFSWSQPQLVDPEAPNYVSVQLLNNPTLTSSRLYSESNTGRLILQFSSYEGVIALHSGAIVQVTMGDTLNGSPGYRVPPLAYGIDLVVEHDADADGIFDVIRAEMPALRVVGTDVDTLTITAPSIPQDSTFRVIVQALEGHDRLTENMYVVPGYSGTIHFSSTDPRAELPDDHTFAPTDEGVKTFNITLKSEGVQRLFVESLDGQLSGTSNPILIGTSNDTDLTSLMRNKRIFWGSMHQHTNIGGHGAQTPQYAYGYARNISGLDFFSLSEHCERDHYDWQYNCRLADEFYEPGNFVTFAAYEWSMPSYGHRHVILLNGLSEECFCAHLLNNPTNKLASTLQDLFDAYYGRDAIFILHHAAWRYSVELRDPETNDVVLGEKLNPNQCLYEIYSHHGSSESYNNAPYAIHGNISHQWEPERRVYFQDALNQGYRFGVTADGDDHMGQPGGHIGPGVNVGEAGGDTSDFHYSRLGITAVYADTLTRGGVWEALRSRRTYGTTGARIILAFSVDDAVMGEEISATTSPRIKAFVIGTDTIRSISVIRNGYDTIFEVNPESSEAVIDFTDTNVNSGETYSYYMRVAQNDDHRAWSSPIWVTIDRKQNVDPLPFNIVSVIPNPYNTSAKITFSQPQQMPVTATIFSVDGKLIRTLVSNAMFPPGPNDLVWSGQNFHGERAASGIYFIRIRNKLGYRTAKIVLLR